MEQLDQLVESDDPEEREYRLNVAKWLGNFLPTIKDQLTERERAEREPAEEPQLDYMEHDSGSSDLEIEETTIS